MNGFDWNQMRAFLATAEAGTLSAAARKLGLSQPTLSRQVAALEDSLGVTLFERVGKSLLLTGPGADLLEHARHMGGAADMIALAATGRSEVAEGLVSISASDGYAAHILPRIVKRICEQEPRLTIEVIASNELSDLRRREADIAIRHVRPEQPDLIAKLVREASAGFYAAQAWVDRHGLPRTAGEVGAADFIGFDRGGRALEYLRGLGLDIPARNFRVFCENSCVTWEMIRNGLGIGAMADDVAGGTDGVVRVLEDLPPIRFPIWLVTHRELRTSRRIRAVYDMLAEDLSRPRQRGE